MKADNTVDPDEYKLKRKRNNESVQKCRMNEKKRVESARIQLDAYKQEEKELDEKYANLQKELQVLKSLFHTSTSEDTVELTANSTKKSGGQVAQREADGNEKKKQEQSGPIKKHAYSHLNALLGFEKPADDEKDSHEPITFPRDHEYGLRKKYAKK
jgi:hypothetical protein